MSSGVIVTNPFAGNPKRSHHRKIQLKKIWSQKNIHAVEDIQLNNTASFLEKIKILKPDNIAVIGGDGSLHLIVNELMKHFSKNDRPCVWPVHAGSGSDFCRTLARDRDEDLQKDTERIVDVIEMSCPEKKFHHFAINVADIGFVFDVMRDVNPLSRRWPAFLRYFLGTWQAFKKSQPLEIKITELENKKIIFSGDILNLAIANGAFFGRGLKIAPQAKIDDGFMNLIVMQPMNRWQFFSHSPALIQQGLAANGPYHSTYKNRGVRITTKNRALPLEADGETLGEFNELTFKILPGEIRIRATGRSPLQAPLIIF